MYKKHVFLLMTMPISVNCFAADISDILSPNTVTQNACVYANTGVYQGEFVMVPIYEDTIYNCGAGYYLPKLSENCVLCRENSYCPGGDYTYSESDDTGISTCPDGTFAPNGMWELAQCGRKLHIGDAVLFLRASKQTEHALHIDINADGVADYYANLTTIDTPMSKDTDKKLKIKIDDVIYSAYDDTIKLNETDNVTKE